MNPSDDAVPYRYNHRFRAERDRRRWTHVYIAHAIGVTSLTVHRWEHGKCAPQFRHRRKLEELFGMSMAELGFDGPE